MSRILKICRSFAFLASAIVVAGVVFEKTGLGGAIVVGSPFGEGITVALCVVLFLVGLVVVAPGWMGRRTDAWVVAAVAVGGLLLTRSSWLYGLMPPTWPPVVSLSGYVLLMLLFSSIALTGIVGIMRQHGAAVWPRVTSVILFLVAVSLIVWAHLPTGMSPESVWLFQLQVTLFWPLSALAMAALLGFAPSAEPSEDRTA